MSVSSKYGSKYVSEQKYQTLTKSQRRNLKRSRKRREKKEYKMIETIEEYQKRRQEYYEKLSTFATFGRGWTRRVNETTELAKKLI